MNDRLILSRRTLLGAGLVGAIGIVGAACSMPGTGGSTGAFGPPCSRSTSRPDSCHHPRSSAM